MSVTVTVPKMLGEIAGGHRSHSVEGGTIRGALDGLFELHPQLRVHVFDETGSLREHVRCFHNDEGAFDLDQPVTDGDSITILQAVSGGGS